MKKSIPFIISLSILLAPAIFTGCNKETGEKTQSPAELPAPAAWTWGEADSAFISLMEKNHWEISESGSKDQIDFSAPVIDTEQTELLDSGDQNLSPFLVSGYFQNDSLVATRIIRRGAGNKVSEFLIQIRSDYKLDVPAWTSNEKATVTEAGNRIRESVSLFETDESIYRVTVSAVDAAENKMKKGKFDEAEIMIFPKKQNPGISIEALSAES